MKRYFDPVTLRMFVSVCEARNIARAAERESIVPSAISKRIAALEAEAGVRLLVRNRRGIEPTPAGDALQRHAREMLGAMERMHAELSEFAGGVHGSIRVLASLSALSEFLPGDVGRFLARHRSLRVSFDERVSSEIVRGVRDGSADFGVCWDAGDMGGLQALGYRLDHLAIVVPAVHALAARRKVAFADTLSCEHIEILASSIVQSTLSRAAAQAGLVLRQRIQVTNFDAACRNVAAGLGIAVVPVEVAAAYADALRLKLVPLTDAWAKRRFVICVRDRKALSEPARLLVDYLHGAAARAQKPA